MESERRIIKIERIENGWLVFWEWKEDVGDLKIHKEYMTMGELTVALRDSEDWE